MTLQFDTEFRERNEIEVEHAHAGVTARLSPEIAGYGKLIGVSQPMRRLFTLLVRLESSLATVLIQGESGTGKELIARALHEHSAVAAQPFVAVNCGALEPSLVRSELFGHRRGSFTGAIHSQIGAFELANGGTLFLDEISEVPVDAQAVLLRAIELGTIVRIGESTERKVRLRIIAATNRDLAADVKAGDFREDLYYRLAVVRLDVAPLRERPADIEPLAQHFARELGLSDVPPELLLELRARSFPGNVRELRNALHAYAAIGLAAGPCHEHGRLEATLHEQIDVTKPYASQKDGFLKLFRRLYVQKLLAHTKGNQSEAARLSGLERSYLNKIISQLSECTPNVVAECSGNFHDRSPPDCSSAND